MVKRPPAFYAFYAQSWSLKKRSMADESNDSPFKVLKKSAGELRITFLFFCRNAAKTITSCYITSWMPYTASRSTAKSRRHEHRKQSRSRKSKSQQSRLPSFYSFHEVSGFLDNLKVRKINSTKLSLSRCWVNAKWTDWWKVVNFAQWHQLWNFGNREWSHSVDQLLAEAHQELPGNWISSQEQ